VSVSEQAVLGALGKVLAPGAPSTPADVVSLGYVKDLSLTDGVKLRIEFPAPLTPARRAAGDAARAALAAAFPGAKVAVEVEGRIPSAFVGGDPGPKKKVLAPGVKNFIAVGSGKGGVGKSTIAVNLAVGLARAGARVGLLDADVYGPSVPLLMGVTRQAFLEEMSLRHAKGEGRGEDGNPLLLPHEAHGVRVMSLGFVVEPDKAAIWRGPMVHGAIQQLLGDVVWGELDYLVMDLPPGTGDVHLSLAQSVPLTGAVVVCTPQPVALADARKAVDLFRSTKTDLLGLVENMSYYACPHCGQHDDVFGGGGAKDAAFEWKVPFLGAVPLDTRVRITGDKGVPALAEGAAAGPVTDALWAVVDAVTGVMAERVRAKPRSLPIKRS
jgi:ATP-binding protein involved in chromosome partitioning